MPLLSDLAQGVLQQYPDRPPLAKEVVTMMEENFAHALSYLEHPKPWLPEPENLRHRGLFLEISSIIAELLDDAVRLTTRHGEPPIPAWLPHLIHYWHERQCVVISLNHDVLIETVASTALSASEPLWAHHLYLPLLSDARLRAGDWKPFSPRETLILLKLHGSTNWFYSGRSAVFGEPIYFLNPPRPSGEDDAAFRHHARAVADKYPFLVPPIYDQSTLLTHETIRAQWMEAAHALQHASRLICLGYSLPPSDIIMHHFLRTSLSPRVVVEVVDENEGIVRNYRESLAQTQAEVRGTYSGPRAIEQLAGSLQPTQP